MTIEEIKKYVPKGFEYINFEDETFREAFASCFTSDKEVLLIMGSGGCGKSEIYKMVATYYGTKAVCCATTGVAAYNLETDKIHPRTVASVFGFGTVPYFDTSFVESDSTIAENIEKAFTHAEILLIDEVSMLNADHLDLILCLVGRYNKKHPTKTVKIVLFGDPLQLPSVWDEKIMLSIEDVKTNYTSEIWNFYDSYFFKEKKEKNKVGIFALTCNFRQSDPDFIKTLRNTRLGIFTYDDYIFLSECAKGRVGDEITKLCFTNSEVNFFNKLAIEKLEKTNPEKRIHSTAIYEEGYRSKDIKDKAFIPELDIIVGEKMMCTRNYYDANHNMIFQNGTIGTVVDILSSGPLLRTDSGNEFLVPKVSFNEDFYYSDAKGRTAFNREAKAWQYPLRPAYAVTFHKAQGLTMDKVYLSLHDNLIRENPAILNSMIYMGLSRVRTKQGLYISHKLTRDYIVANKNSIDFWLQNCPEDKSVTIYQKA